MRRGLVFVFFIMYLSLASSQIYFNQEFKQSYNLNDLIEINFTIDKDSSIDYVTSFLTCNSDDEIIYRRLLDKGTRQTVSFYSLAEKKGNCTVSVEYSGEEKVSSTFRITDLLQSNISLNNKFFYPLESLNVFGEVNKINGQKVNGSVTIQIANIENKSFEVSDGKFNFNYTFSKDVPFGNYSLSLILLEKGDKLINSMKFNDTIYILQKPSYLETVAIESFKPASNFSFISYLQDQSKITLLNESVIVKVFDPSNQIFYQGNIISGSTKELSFLDNASRGTWTINSYYGSIFNSKQFYVLDNKKVSITLDELNNKLIIQNVGNTVFEGIIAVNFSNENETVPIFINLTLSKNQIIQQPVNLSGNYTFSSEGAEPRRVYLTGAVVAGDIFRGLESKVLIWITIFILFLLFSGLIIFFKKKKSGMSSRNSKSFKEVTNKIYSVFLEYSSIAGVEDLVRDRGFNLQTVDSSHGFVVFSSSSSKFSEEKIIQLFMDFKKRGLNISASAHSQEYNFNKEKIKEVIEIARKLSGGSKGLYISQDIFLASRNYQSSFKFVPSSSIGERVINRYILAS